jgi:phosphatidate cytidylyltransferase
VTCPDGYDSDEEPDVSSEPITEKVRIFGAEPAGAVASGPDAGGTAEGELPSLGGDIDEGFEGSSHSGPGSHSASGFGERAEPDVPPAGVAAPHPPRALEETERVGSVSGEPSGAVPLLPHWTDPPTGQVPAIVDRRSESDWDPLTPPGGGPSWREHDHEWEDSGFDASLLADDGTRIGALEDTPLSERQPWEFEDLAPRRGSTTEFGGDESWWDEPEGENHGTVELSDEYGYEDERAFSAGSSSSEPATTRMGSYEGSGSGSAVDSSDEGTVVASISSSPLRGPSDRPRVTSGRGAHGRRPARFEDRAGGGAGRGAPRSMPLAIATGVGFAALALICFAAGSVATLALATVAVTLASAECYAALRRTGRRPATLLGLVATVGVMVSVYAKGVAALGLVLVLLVVTSMLWYLAGAERGSAVEGITSTVLTFAWIGVLGSFASLMLAPSQYPHRHGVAFAFGALAAVVAADVGALAVGKWIGRHPLAPNISPRKTWEGLIGGAVLAIAVSAGITGHVHPWTPEKATLLGVVVAVLAPLGDLCESMIKRDLGLKDMGALLPGHGGVLDRIDGLLFVLPATYYLVRVLHLG